MQAYAPFRTSLLTPAELRQMASLRPGVAVRDAIVRWIIMFGAWAAAAVWTNVFVVVAAAVVVGVNYYGMMIIAHDGLHRRLFNSAERNDLFNDLLLIGPIGAVTHLNRVNHMDHHRVTCLPEDPDRHKYVHAGKEPLLPFAFFLSGLSNLVPTLANVFFKGAAKKRAVEPAEAAPRDSYTLRDIAIIIGWQAALIGGLTYFIGWWAYPVLWAGPVYLFAYRGDLTRVFCEHSVLTSDEDADRSMRLVTYTSNWAERQVFAPQNMNYHMVHHLWPSIPYYNLPKADALVRKSAKDDPLLVWRKSYVGFLASYVRWRMAGQKLPTAAAAS